MVDSMILNCLKRILNTGFGKTWALAVKSRMVIPETSAMKTNESAVVGLRLNIILQS